MAAVAKRPGRTSRTKSGGVISCRTMPTGGAPLYPADNFKRLPIDLLGAGRRDDVAFVYGSRWKQRYFTKIGDDYYPEPAHSWLTAWYCPR